MRTDRFLLSCIWLMAGLTSSAQQLALHTQYMFNKTALNPAATATCRSIDILGASRFQWLGLENDSTHLTGPRNYLLNVEMPIYPIKSGVGLKMEYDLAGYEKNLNLTANYAFHLTIKEINVLSFGLSVDLLKKSIDYSQLNPFDGGDPLLSESGTESGLLTDLGLGIYYTFKDKFYAGVSAKQLLQSSTEIGAMDYTLARHYFLITGYDFKLTQGENSSFILSTGILARSSIAVTQVEANALLKYDHRYWGGVFYRMGDAVGLIAGMKINAFSVGISYDYTVSSLSKAGSKGSPEIFIGYSHPVIPKTAGKD